MKDFFHELLRNDDCTSAGIMVVSGITATPSKKLDFPSFFVIVTLLVHCIIWVYPLQPVEHQLAECEH